MPPHRDVARFEERAPRYDEGWLGRLHHEIADRTAALAHQTIDSPRRVLDVGCGTGYLLRALLARYPGAEQFVGIDAAPSMIEAARVGSGDDRLGFAVGAAEDLASADGYFDLVVSTTSFDHWADQRLGLKECHRVLGEGGRLVLVDQFSNWLWPTLVVSRRGKARTRRRVGPLLADAGFGVPVWHDVYGVLIKGVTAAW